jgi:hypothetical protein
MAFPRAAFGVYQADSLRNLPGVVPPMCSITCFPDVSLSREKDRERQKEAETHAQRVSKVIRRILVKAGIPIIRSGWDKPFAPPRFEVQVLYGLVHNKPASFSVEMHLIQEVYLARDPNIKIESVTWKYGPIQGERYVDGEPEPEWGADRHIREGVANFISSFQSQNWKE